MKGGVDPQMEKVCISEYLLNISNAINPAKKEK